MTQRFVSGGSGKFTFDVANKLIDTAERLEGNMPSDDSKSARLNDRPIMAQLIEQVTDVIVESSSPEPLSVWRWKYADVYREDDPNRERKISTLNASVSSEGYGAYPSGLAIQLNGFASRLDYVLLQPLATAGRVSNERWFGFYGASDPIASGTFGVLKIGGSEEDEDGKWLYRVRTGRYRIAAGGTVPTFDTSAGTEGLAWNLYERSARYGQILAQPNGRLEVIGPIPLGSLVLGTYQMRFATGEPFYVFSAPNGLRAVCDGPGMMMMQQQGDARLLRDGI